ncbi:hypothetical protein KKF32_02940 [Patescibacteria group bacterium]|nr:hypothetical protein [Patescibacteria group bacterium]
MPALGNEAFSQLRGHITGEFVSKFLFNLLGLETTPSGSKGEGAPTIEREYHDQVAMKHFLKLFKERHPELVPMLDELLTIMQPADHQELRNTVLSAVTAEALIAVFSEGKKEVRGITMEKIQAKTFLPDFSSKENYTVIIELVADVIGNPALATRGAKAVLERLRQIGFCSNALTTKLVGRLKELTNLNSLSEWLQQLVQETHGRLTTMLARSQETLQKSRAAFFAALQETRTSNKTAASPRSRTFS